MKITKKQLQRIINESIGKAIKMEDNEYTALKRMSSKLFDKFTDNEKIFFYDMLNHNTWDVVYAMMGVLKPSLPDGWIYESKLRKIVNKPVGKVLRENETLDEKEPIYIDYPPRIDGDEWDVDIDSEDAPLMTFRIGDCGKGERCGWVALKKAFKYLEEHGLIQKYAVDPNIAKEDPNEYYPYHGYYLPVVYCDVY